MINFVCSTTAKETRSVFRVVFGQNRSLVAALRKPEKISSILFRTYKIVIGVVQRKILTMPCFHRVCPRVAKVDHRTAAKDFKSRVKEANIFFVRFVSFCSPHKRNWSLLSAQRKLWKIEAGEKLTMVFFASRFGPVRVVGERVTQSIEASKEIQ